MILNKNDVIETVIDDMGINGEGIAHADGITVFVRGAIAGEKVRAKIIYAGKTYCVAILEKIIKASPHRTEALCPYFNKCGGCAFQHVCYESQLEFKRKNLENTLKKQGVPTDKIKDIVPSNKEYGYRNKLTLPVRYPYKIGFFRPESHSVTETEDCLLQNFDCAGIIRLLKEFMQNSGLAGYEEQSGKGDIRHLSVRFLGGRYYICIVATHDISKKLAEFARVINDCFSSDYAMWLNVNPKKTNVIFSDEFIFINGWLDEIEFESLKIAPHPAAFFQVNDYICRLLYAEAAEETKDYPVVIDAYSGIGVLGARLAETAEKVVAVEINEKAHSSALALKETNGIDNLTPLCGDCADKLGGILSDAKGRKTAVVLDPPRSGADGRVISAISESLPEKVVYISCNAATLARDLKLLCEKYDVKSIRPYDMFPQTPSLETLVVLVRKNPRR